MIFQASEQQFNLAAIFCWHDSSAFFRHVTILSSRLLPVPLAHVSCGVQVDSQYVFSYDHSSVLFVSSSSLGLTGCSWMSKRNRPWIGLYVSGVVACLLQCGLTWFERNRSSVFLGTVKFRAWASPIFLSDAITLSSYVSILACSRFWKRIFLLQPVSLSRCALFVGVFFIGNVFVVRAVHLKQARSESVELRRSTW